MESLLVSFALLLPVLGVFPNLGITLPDQAPPDPAAEAARFEAVAKQLDTGGVLYAYVGVDGDLEAIGKFAEDMIAQFRELNPGDIPFEIDVTTLLKISGLDAVSAVGMSSKRVGEVFMNKTYVHVPKGRKGLMRILGGKSKPFEVVDLAPAGAEIVVEQDLNLKVAYEAVQEAFGVVMGEQGKAMVKVFTSQPMPPFSFTPERLLTNLDTRFTVVVDADPDKKIKVPDAEEVEMPLLHAAVLVDGFGWFADEVALVLERLRAQGAGQGPQMPFAVFRDAKWVGAQLEIGPEDYQQMDAEGLALFGGEKPVLLHHRPSGKLVLASGKNFAEKLFMPKPNLKDDPHFRNTMKALPREGTSLTYFSPELFRIVRQVFGEVIKTAPGPSEAAFATAALDLFFPPNAKGEGSVTTNVGQGSLTIAASSHSHKNKLVSGLMGPFGMSAASMMIPMMVFGAQNAEFIDQEVDVKIEEIEALENLDDALDVPVGGGRNQPRKGKNDKKFEREGD